MLEVLDGGQQPLRKDEEVLVGEHDRSARVICPEFYTHVYRGMVSVDFGDGELELVEQEQVRRITT